MKKNSIEIIWFIYYSSKEAFDFRIFKTIRSFVDDMYNRRIDVDESD